MSSGLPSESRLLKRDAAAANSRMPETVPDTFSGESAESGESSRRRLLLEAVLEPPADSTPASNGLGTFPFRDAAPGLENPGKQQSAR